MFSLDCFEENEPADFQYWNNWEPLKTSSKIETKKQKDLFSCDQKKPFNRLSSDPKFGNWIPPLNFDKNKISIIHKPLEEGKSKVVVENRKRTKASVERTLLKWRRPLNSDWGERVELHDVSKYEDGTTIWGFVTLSSFTCIKMWVNEYNNICGCASGTLHRPGSSEKAFIIVTDLQLLRKLLNVTNFQWLSLCEAVQQSKANLKMETLKEVKASEMNYLEKLWFFICNRRHFYPKQSMLVKLDGAIKCMKELKIIAKLIVVNIRDEEGEEIL